MDSEIALKIVGLVLEVFGLQPGLFSKIKDAILIGKDIAEKNKLSEKGKFIRELIETAEKITRNENCSEDVIKNIEETLTDPKRFSAKNILEHINDVDGYITELSQSYSETDPSAEGYKSAMEQLLTVVYKNLQTLGVASDSDEVILNQLYSYEKLSKEDHAILLELKYRDTFAEWLDGQILPQQIKSNIFNYCNPQIGFYGREQELEELQEFMEQPFVSVWGIAGPGGSGKSKLARQFAINKEKDIKTVWLDDNRIKKLLNDDFNNDYSYPQPVLFICDYSAQYEDELKKLIEKFCGHPSARVKFLLLERQKNWYVSFLKNNDLVCDNALKHNGEIKEPIDLTNAELDEQACKNIIHDLAVSKDENNQLRYPDANLQDEDYAKIIARAKELSENKTAIRCLFMLLLTDAFLRGEKIQEMDAEALLHNYIDRSKKHIAKLYSDDLANRGFKILAYATAHDGLNIENEYCAIQEELDFIMDILDDMNAIDKFFSRLGESEENGTISALKPDIVGEFLFLHTWNKLIPKKKSKWLADLLKNDFSMVFLARCITDWYGEGTSFRNELLSDEKLFIIVKCMKRNFAKIYKNAILMISSITEARNFQFDFEAFICKFEKNDYIQIVDLYIDSLKHIISISDNNDRENVRSILNKITAELQDYESDYNKNQIRKVFYKLGNIFTELSMFDDAYTCFRKAFDILDGNEDIELAFMYRERGWLNYQCDKLDDAISDYKNAIMFFKRLLKEENFELAYCYSHLGLVYTQKRSDESLKYYNNALRILESICGTNSTIIAPTYNNIGLQHYYSGNYDLALKNYYKALRIMQKLKIVNKFTTIYMHNIAAALRKKKAFKRAIKLLRKVLLIKINLFGRTDPYVATTINMLAKVYKDVKNYKMAIYYFRLAYSIRIKVLPPEHQYIIEDLECISECEKQLSLTNAIK